MTATTRPTAHQGIAALLLAGALMLTACGSDGESDAATGPAEVGTPASLDAESTTTPSAPADATTTEAPAETTAAPTTTAAEPVGVDDPATAATRLYDAWTADDREAAATIAQPAAIEAIFGATPGPYELYRGCDTGEFDTGGCLFRDRSTNNTIQIDLERRDSGWVVSGAFFSPG